MEDAMGLIEASIALLSEQQEKLEKSQSHPGHDLRHLLGMQVNGTDNGKSAGPENTDNNSAALEQHLQQRQEGEHHEYRNGNGNSSTGNDLDDAASQGYSVISVQTFAGNEYEYEYDTTMPTPVHVISVSHPLDTICSSGGEDGVYESEMAFYDSGRGEGIGNTGNGPFEWA
jgi:hypothetical protein